MNRRELIKQVACTAALGMFNLGISRKAYAATAERNWVFITAGGGWDPVSQWDPKGSEIVGHRGPVTHYSRENVRSAGNIRYAPVPEGIGTADKLHEFTQKHYQKMMVINGIDQGTNNHAVGYRIAMVGSDVRGLPAMGALFAAPYAEDQSMPFIVAGGYSDTAGLLSQTHLLDRNGYFELLNPDRHLHTPQVFDLLRQRKADQLNTLLQNAETEAEIRALTNLATARNGAGGIAELLERIPGELSGDHYFAAAELGAAAFASGAATSLSMDVGGFDTHRVNDQGQWSRMDHLLTVVDYVIEQLTVQDVLHKTTIVVNSDFGRRPFYNHLEFGKDHWPITSMLLMGAGIEGNRVLGGTDDFMYARLFNPLTLIEDGGGIRFTPNSIYAALRRSAGVEGSDLDIRYPLNAQYMAVFD